MADPATHLFAEKDKFAAPPPHVLVIETPSSCAQEDGVRACGRRELASYHDPVADGTRPDFASAFAAALSASSTSWRFQRLRAGRLNQRQVSSPAASGMTTIAAARRRNHELFVRLAISYTATSATTATSHTPATNRCVRVQNLSMSPPGRQ